MTIKNFVIHIVSKRNVRPWRDRGIFNHNFEFFYLAEREILILYNRFLSFYTFFQLIKSPFLNRKFLKKLGTVDVACVWCFKDKPNCTILIWIVLLIVRTIPDLLNIVKFCSLTHIERPKVNKRLFYIWHTYPVHIILWYS